MIEYTTKTVNVDILESYTELFADFGRMIVKDVAQAARQEWIAAAQRELDSTRRTYVEAIQEVEEQGGTAVIKLVGPFPVMIEQGADPFDMHDTLLNPADPLVKPTGAGGYYRNVPFQHSGPNAGFAVGTPMGFQFREQLGIAGSKKLGAKVMRQARKLGTGQKGKYVTKSGNRLKAGLADLLRTHHSTDLYAGMARIREGTGRGSSSRYMTWRRITSAGKGSGKWLHPGIKPPRRLVDIVLERLEELTAPIVEGYIDGLMLGGKQAP